jgi:ribose transport system permease protein
MATAQTLLMISGSFDISVGAVYAFSGIVFALTWTESPALAIPLALAAGAAVGFLNGVAVAICHVNAFIATLGMLLIVRGINLPLTDSGVIFVEDTSFRWIGTEKLGSIPVQVFIFLGVVVAAGYFLRRMSVGRHFYAVGGNIHAAFLAGLRLRAIVIGAFVLSGLSAGLAGIMHTSEVGAAKSDVGAGLEFSVITAVVLGGTSLFGGRGSVWRTFVAVLFIAFLQNGFNLLTLAPFYQQAITGVVLLIAVAVDGLRHNVRGAAVA